MCIFVIKLSYNAKDCFYYIIFQAKVVELSAKWVLKFDFDINFISINFFM